MGDEDDYEDRRVLTLPPLPHFVSPPPPASTVDLNGRQLQVQITAKNGKTKKHSHRNEIGHCKTCEYHPHT
jgi:hypothetical protein